MACFLISAGEAIAVSVAAKIAEKKEKDPETVRLDLGSGHTEVAEKIPFSRKLKWLRNMLWGGAILLAFEHVWHGEVVPWFPFLSAAADPVDTAEMLHEMATVGVAMAVLVTAVWLGVLAVCAVIEKRARKTAAEAE